MREKRKGVPNSSAVLVLIRVVLQRQLPVSFRELGVGGILVHAEDLS